MEKMDIFLQFLISAPICSVMGNTDGTMRHQFLFDAWKKAITDSQMRVQNVGFEANIIENHDEPRGVSRFLPDYAQNADGAKMLGTVSVLLRGIPFIYQGQEIGMQNARWNSVDEFDDISTKDQYRMAREAGLSDAEALAVCSAMSRDNARTPMQWKDAPQAGFLHRELHG